MPYQIKKVKGGYKVELIHNPSHVFSKKPQTKQQAIKQMQAVAISEHKNLGARSKKKG